MFEKIDPVLFRKKVLMLGVGKAYQVHAYHSSGVYRFVGETGDNLWFKDQRGEVVILKKSDIYSIELSEVNPYGIHTSLK